MYDNNGNLTSSSGKGFEWDWRNRLKKAGVTGGATTTYAYDHENQRVQKVGGSATTTYVNMYYNVASTSSNATATKHIFTPSGELLATIIGTSSAATTTYLHLDHLGGTNVTTDGNQATSQVLDYYPYGSQRIATGSHDSQRRFIGEHYDPETDFSYLNARYYQGSRGQFMSQDPVFLAVGDPHRMKDISQVELVAAILTDPQILNSYSYARNNPITLRDPEGKYAQALAPALAVPGVIPAILIGGAAISTYYAIQYALSKREGLCQIRLKYSRSSESLTPSIARAKMDSTNHHWRHRGRSHARSITALC